MKISFPVFFSKIGKTFVNRENVPFKSTQWKELMIHKRNVAFGLSLLLEKVILTKHFKTDK